MLQFVETRVLSCLKWGEISKYWQNIIKRYKVYQKVSSIRIFYFIKYHNVHKHFEFLFLLKKTWFYIIVSHRCEVNKHQSSFCNYLTRPPSPTLILAHRNFTMKSFQWWSRGRSVGTTTCAKILKTNLRALVCFCFDLKHLWYLS